MGPLCGAVALSPPMAQLREASGPLPLSPLRGTGGRVSSQHYFTEEETEVQGPRRQEAGFWPGRAVSPRLSRPHGPQGCPRRAGVLRAARDAESGFLVCKVGVRDGPKAGGPQARPQRRVRVFSVPGAPSPAETPGLREQSGGLSRPRGTGGRGGAQPTGSHLRAPARTCARRLGTPLTLPTGPGGASWAGLGQPPGDDRESPLPGAGTATSARAPRVPVARGWRRPAGRDLPQEAVQALSARVPPQERRAAHAAGGRCLAGDLA